jgi:hypothetical protein
MGSGVVGMTESQLALLLLTVVWVAALLTMLVERWA